VGCAGAGAQATLGMVEEFMQHVLHLVGKYDCNLCVLYGPM